MASLSASPALPWTAAQLTAARTAGTRHSWRLQDTYGDGVWSVPCHDVTYTLDETSQPLGRLSFTADPITATDFAGLAFDPIEALSPWWLYAGYEDTLQPVFAGYPYSRRRVQNASENGLKVEMDTGESLFDGPLSGDYAVPDAYTSVAQVLDANPGIPGTSVFGSTWPARPWVSPALGTPTSDQLAAFRALDFSAGDSVGDMYRTCAAALGQRLQADHLGGKRSPELDWDYTPVVKLVPEFVFDVAAALTINPNEWVSYERIDSADDYASALRLTAQWTSSGDLKSSTYVYDSMPFIQNRAVCRDVTVQLRPELSGGVRKLTANNPLGKAYAAAYLRRTWQTTVTMRAWWWLEPGASLTIVGPEGQSDNGVVSRVVFNVDAGLMTVTIRPS